MSDRTTNYIMMIIVIINDISTATIKTTFVMLENFAAFDYNIVLMTQACVRHDHKNVNSFNSCILSTRIIQ